MVIAIFFRIENNTCLLLCYEELRNLQNNSPLLELSLRLTKDRCTQDLISDVAPLHGIASTMMQRDAKAKVASHIAAALPLSIIKRPLRVNNSRVVAQMLDAYSPNLIMTGATKDTSKSKVSLKDFGTPLRLERLPCRILGQHLFQKVPTSSKPTISFEIRSLNTPNVTNELSINLNNAIMIF